MAKKKLNISDQIKTYQDACTYNGKQPIDEAKLIEAGVTPPQIAGIKLEDITRALNEGKPTDIYNGQRRYYPVFWTYPWSFRLRFLVLVLRLHVCGCGHGFPPLVPRRSYIRLFGKTIC